jgi:ribosomal protein L7/L12
MTESDMQELQGAVGELAKAVMELADAVKDGPFSDSATMRVAVSVSNTARHVAGRFGVRDWAIADPDPAGAGAVAIPEDVVALARAGKTLEAVTRYRAASGASLDEAKAVIRDIT